MPGSRDLSGLNMELPRAPIKAMFGEREFTEYKASNPPDPTKASNPPDPTKRSRDLILAVSISYLGPHTCSYEMGRKISSVSVEKSSAR